MNAPSPLPDSIGGDRDPLPVASEDTLSVPATLAISSAYWLTLGLATLLFALLALAPRIADGGRLRQRWLENLAEEQRFNAEIRHLAQVADALEHDPEFVSRVATTELATSVPGRVSLPVDAGLSFDARVPQTARPHEVPPLPWYLPVIEHLARPSPLRSRCIVATALLVLAAFLFLNESFFSGRMGRRLLAGLSAIPERYRLQSS